MRIIKTAMVSNDPVVKVVDVICDVVDIVPDVVSEEVIHTGE